MPGGKKKRDNPFAKHLEECLCIVYLIFIETTCLQQFPTMPCENKNCLRSSSDLLSLCGIPPSLSLQLGSEQERALVGTEAHVERSSVDRYGYMDISRGIWVYSFC